MAHLYIPLDGVPIVPSPPDASFIAADGYVVFALSVRQFYAYNQALGIWQPAGGGIIVADTDSIDLTDTAGTLTADVRISTDAASAGNIKAAITVQTGASPGLLAVVSESAIKALFSVSDTDSVDLTYSSGATSADVRLSANAADAGYQLVNVNIESLVSKGLRAQISNSAITGLISVTDTDEINLSYSSGAISANLVFSADPADIGYKAVELQVETPATSAGLRAQISESNIQSAISVSDTDSLDMTYNAGIMNGDVRLSTDAADAGYTIVGLSIQSGASKGLRAQVQNTAIQGLFSASAPIVYSAGAFSFDTATTALTAYLLKTGGTMTGAIVSAIAYSNTGVVSTALHPAAWITVNNNRETVLTFDQTKGGTFKIIISAINRPPVEIICSYHSALLTVLSDQDNLYTEADSGTGFYVHKTANNATLTIKKNISGNNEVLITIKEGVLLSATAWA
jgi:hypothetical protein